MEEVSKLLDIPAANRRRFVRNLGLAAAAAGVVASSPSAHADTTSPTDVDILNFALNLEYLEAEFYTVATTGLTLSSFGFDISGSGTVGATTGGAQIPFSTSNSLIRRVALELAADERTHVSLLKNTIISLGGAPVAKPAINLNALGSSFFTSQNMFLVLARVFEEIGVTAYGGAAGLISNKTVLSYAARILATEAEHVGFIRSLIVANSIATTALDAVDVLPPPSGTMYFSTNSNAITAVRTPGQVLYLAYGVTGSTAATSGGFFPSGVNGNLYTSATASAVTDGVTFTITPNPVPSTNGLGTATLTWSCPSTVQYVEIRIGSASGPLFATGTGSGTMTTGAWVTDGMIFYLQNFTYPYNLTNPPTPATTLATVTATLQGIP